MWNKRHPDDMISVDDARLIWKNLKRKMQNVCNEESCWLRQGFAINNITPDMLQYTFMPMAPKTWKKNKNTWLNSTDISRVMMQYEKRYPEFAFIGPSPIDFNSQERTSNTCVWAELCNFEIAHHLKNNKTKIGIIFNLDEHWKSGSHWVSLFIDADNGVIFYFDSTGDEIPHQIKTFIDRVTKQGKSLNQPIDFKYDSSKGIEHQQENTECGIYCLHFISTILGKIKTFKDFKTTKISDDQMEKCRKYFFNIL
jgi:hypothetical protein